MNQAVWLWLIACVVLIVIELSTAALTTVWFAGGALCGFLAALFHLSWRWQLAIFVVVSLVLLFALRPVVIKYVKPTRTRTNVEGLIGKEAMVLTEINNEQEEGTARVNGQEWTARSADGAVIPAGTPVTVQEVRGVKLIVK